MADEVKNEITVLPASKDTCLNLHGRRVIYSPYDEVDESNIVDALNKTLPVHYMNREEINFLWGYYRGKQPVINRKKDVRPDIKNKLIENHAQEIVAFKIGYQLSEPLQYTCRLTNGNDDDESYTKRLNAVNELNALMFAEDKASCDRDLFEWMTIAGVGYRMVEADSECDSEEGGSPFEIFTLDPRCTFVAYSSSYHKHPVFAVWIGYNPDTKEEIYNVYTGDTYYRVINDEVVHTQSHTYKVVPIIEYPLNNARMGVFESVITLLDAINTLESNRIDDVEQTVQALLKLVNCDIDQDTYKKMLELGAVKVKSSDPNVKADIDYISTTLDHNGMQTTKDDLYQSVVNICGMPNRSVGGGSTSDTGAAVLLRDGWTLAESHAKSYELQFKRSERQFLRLILNICDQAEGIKLDLFTRDVEFAFNRRNYENILAKSQVLTTMLASDKIHPYLAFQSCGMFTDPDAAYKKSQEYMEERGMTIEESVLAVAIDDVINNGAQPSGDNDE